MTDQPKMLPCPHEIWKPVIGYEGLYEVSNLGNVAKLVSGAHEPVHATKDVHGYRRVIISSDGKKKHQRVCRLVATAFLPPSSSEQQSVDHIDCDKANDSLSNLRYVDSRINALNQKNRAFILPAGVKKSANKYQAQAYLHGKKRHLGSFSTPEEAHAAYLKAVENIGAVIPNDVLKVRGMSHAK